MSAFDLGPKLKRSCEDALHKAKMAWKGGDHVAAAGHFDAASKIMFKYAEYAGSRAQEYARKKKAIEYRDFARRLREIHDEESAGAKAHKLPAPPSADEDVDTRQTEEAGKDAEISSAVSSLVTTSPVTWDDIGGLVETKRDIKYTLGLSLATPPKGVKIAAFRNIMFFGPPGTGKTLMAAATSNSLKAGGEGNALFFNVKVSGVMSKYFGESSKIISEIYGTARDNSPSVVFLDEFESLTATRGADEQTGAERRILSTILSELDGLSEKGRGDIFVLTIAATNRPWEIDSAVLSRFEKQILIPLPDPVTREAILNIHLLKKGFELAGEIADLVEITDGFSGREIERLVKQATTTMIAELNDDLPDLVDKGLKEAKGYQVKIRALSVDDFRKAATGIAPVTSAEEMKRYLDWRQDE
ncbi:MAG: ATP-binding protein [Planctomycetes bacterium]|nr:ATP-binding protein [Planctomycetota bacterium]